MTYPDSDATIRKRSGWLIPLGVFVITAGLSAVVLLAYLAPAASDFRAQQIVPTAQTRPVELEIHGLKLWIPAHYIEYSSARDGGAQKDVALFAVLPDLAGWTPEEAANFSSNAADSPVVYLLIHEDSLNLDELSRFSRIYLSYVANGQGAPGPFNLTQYAFRDDSGYRNSDLFVGEGPHGQVVMRCDRFSPEVPSPSCQRDLLIGRAVALSYRFKRAHLAQWHDLASRVSQLVDSFKHPPKPQASAQAATPG